MNWHTHFNEMKQQIRLWNVTARQLMARRVDYVPSAMRALAFADIEVPLPCGQSMIRPMIEGCILRTIGTIKVDSILEVGAGSGFFAALLSEHAQHVYTVEIEPVLAQMARDNLARNRVDNVTVEEGDASQGWFAQAPYDMIVVSGCLPELPSGLLSQLKQGGRLFAFIGEPPATRACLVHRHDEKTLLNHPQFETVVPMLQHALPRFHF